MNYKNFVYQIDLDSLYDELDWEPTTQTDTEDKGFCFDPWGYHKNGDTSGKLAINREKMVYNCWVCGGGTILHLVKAIKNWSEEETVDWLYRFTITKENSAEDVISDIEEIMTPPDKVEAPLPYFNPAILKDMNELTTGSSWFWTFLSNRNISKEVAAYFNVIPGRYDESRKSRPVILPHFWDNKLVGWQSQWSLGLPKYTNTSNFPRKQTLWGYHFALAQREAPIIVESVLTALYLISEGYSSVATFGSQITDKQLRLLRVFQQGVQLAPDNDDAGRIWLAKTSDYLQRYIPVLQVPFVTAKIGADLGDVNPDVLSTYLAEVSLA